MNWLLLIYAIAALASALAAVLAWAAKLWWAREFGAAKDEIIKAKEAQIELLKTEVQNLTELTPMKIREYFMSVKVQLEEYNNLLQQQLHEAQLEIEQKDAAISIYSQGTHAAKNLLSGMHDEKLQLEQKAASLQDELDRVQSEMNKSKTLSKVLANFEGQVMRLPSGIFVKAYWDASRFNQGQVQSDVFSFNPLGEASNDSE
jgi:hypothetical protein